MEISTGKVKILLDLGLKKSTRLTIDQLKNQRVIQRNKCTNIGAIDSGYL